MSFLGVPIKPGEKVKKRVGVGELADGSPVTIPVFTVGGQSGGPTLYVQGGLHGDEQTGIEIVRRALTEIDFSDLNGNLVVVPLANVPAHLTRTRGFLHEERWMVDINRIFPGNPAGLLTERIAHTLFTEFVQAADVSLDVHSALDGCNILPFSYVDPDDDEKGSLALRRRLAYAFGTGWVYHRRRGATIGTSDVSRSLGAQSDAAGRVSIAAEMGESRRVTEAFVPTGVRGVKNVLKGMDMLPGEPEVPSKQRSFSKITIVHAERGGGLRRHVELGDMVAAGQPIATVVDVFGESVEELASPADGVILRVMLLGAIHSGAEVVWIGS